MVMVGLIAIVSFTGLFIPQEEKADVKEKDTSGLVSDEESDRKIAGLEKDLENSKKEIARLLEEQKQEELERQKELQSEFDPILVQSALENIPDMQALPREVLKQCKAVKSFSDYQIFAIAVGLMSEDFTITLKQMDAALSILELEGYDKHPEVGPLIKETRRLAGESGDCMIDLINRYEN